MTEYYATTGTTVGLSEAGQMAIIQKSSVQAEPISIPAYRSEKLDDFAAKLAPGDIIYVALFYAIAQNLDGLALFLRLFNKLQVKVQKISFSVNDKPEFGVFCEQDFIETADIIRQEKLILAHKGVGAPNKLSNSAMLKLAEDYKSRKYTNAQLLTKHQISLVTLYKYLDRLGVPRKYQKRKPDDSSE
jgi:hypothetical protein